MVALTSEQKALRRAPRPTRKVGRPSKYKREYALQVIKFCARGFSLTSFAASVGVSRENIEDWRDISAEFSQACDRARTAAAAWWERKSHQQAERGASGGQVAMTLFMLKNFGERDFADKVQHTGPGGAPLSLELLLGKLNAPNTLDVLPSPAMPEMAVEELSAAENGDKWGRETG